MDTNTMNQAVTKIELWWGNEGRGMEQNQWVLDPEL